MRHANCTLVQSGRLSYGFPVPVQYREEPCRSALNPVRGMPFRWSLNPYMGCAHRCTFCYVRAFEHRADRPWGDAYGRSIRVKTNVAEVLRCELHSRRWRRESVTIGAATDPYQPAEGRWRLTRGCLEALLEASNPLSIITRGPLIVRDRDLLRAAALRAEVRVWFSLPTLDPSIWRATEPGTSPPRARLRAIERLAEAGIRVSVLAAPIIPGLTDRPELLDEVVKCAREAGAEKVSAALLHLSPGAREHFLASLGEHWPAERDRLARLFAGRDYLPAERQRELSASMAPLLLGHPRRAGLPEALAPDPAIEPPRFAEQLGLAL